MLLTSNSNPWQLHKISWIQVNIVCACCNKWLKISMLCQLPSNQWFSQDKQVMWAQHGHTQCVCNTHLLGDLGHTPTMKKFLNCTLWDLCFRPQILFFRLTCMLASCPYETSDHTIDCTCLVSSSDLSPWEDWVTRRMRIFTRAQVNLPVGPGVVMPLLSTVLDVA